MTHVAVAAVTTVALLAGGSRVVAAQAPAEAPARPLAVAAALADLALLERTLETIHPGYVRFVPHEQHAARFAAVRERIGGGTTDAALYLEVSRLLEAIRCDHTKAEYPERLWKWREANRSHLPFTTKLLDGRIFLDACAGPGLARGDELIELDGLGAAALQAEILALISIDGRTDFARVAEAEASSEYMGSGLDHFLPLLHGFRDRFTVTVRGDLGRGPARTVEAPALRHGDWAKLAAGAAPQASEFADAVTVERFEDPAVALLRVDTFVNYREPVDAVAKFAALFRELNEEQIDHLIVDLRQNGGGSTDASHALLAHLIEAPLTVGLPPFVRCTRVPDDLRPHLTTWESGAFDPPAALFEPAADGLFRMKGEPSVVAPARESFTGSRITLLSSRGNASGTTMLLAALQPLERVRVVGERTGGSVEGPTAGTLFFLTLPASGIKVRVPVLRNVTGLVPSEPGMGVVPDREAVLTAEEWLAGDDPALAAALGEE